MAEVRLRPMRLADLTAVLAIEAEAFGAEGWTRAQFLEELDAVPESRTCVVAVLDGRVVGYAGLVAGPEQADVLTLAVAVDRRRLGVGRLLLAALVAEARLYGVPEVLLEVRADNEAARDLYAAEGFAEIERRRGYYAQGAVDGLVLRRTIP